MNRALSAAACLFGVATTALGAAGNGLMGEYFDNTALLGTPVLTRTDGTVNFDWGAGGPGSGVSTDRFSARWTGQVAVPTTGAFRFATVSNNGIRLWINNALVIHNWTAHSNTKDVSAPIILTAGQKYDVKIEFYENAGNATAKLLWMPPQQPEAVVPRSSLFSTPVAAGSSSVYLSDLKPTFAQSGWGPYERDRSNGEMGEHDGQPISIGGVKFGRGLGVHSKSDLRYALGGKHQTFTAYVGIDDEVGNRGSVIFQVWIDGVKAYESPVARGTDMAKLVNVSVAGKNELKLIVLDAGDGNGYDHADWADAHLTSGTVGGGGPTVPSAPTGLTAAPGNTQVTLSWTSVAGATGYNLYRGTAANGESSTPMATGITGPSYANTGLTNGTKYFYKIAAVNAAGASDKSNEASAMPTAGPPPSAPAGLTAVPGDKQVALSWTSVAGATSYNVYRGTSANGEATAPVATGITGATFMNTGLTNGTTYFFKIAALNGNGASDKSNEATAMPTAGPPPSAPTGLTAAPGDKQVALSWTSVAGATSYNVYRGTSANAEATAPVATGVTGVTFTNTGLTNSTTYFFKIAALNANGTSAKSNEASATPVPPPPMPAPTGLTATPGDKQVMLSWNSVTGAASYSVFRGTTANGEAGTAITTGLTGVTFMNTGLTNGTVYFYKVAAVGATGTSAKSSEASAMPTAPGLTLSAAQKDAFRFLRQTTWGPNKALVDHVVQVGKSAFLDEQFAATPSVYPDALIDMPNMELVSEQFFQNAIQGNDQLRQRVAWALSQIFVVSGVKVDNTHAMVPYIRMLHDRAFDNVQNIMHDVSLSPAMGEFLDMVNNKKADAIKGTLPNENYAREWLQLLAIGLQELNDNGSPKMGTTGQPIPTYDQSTVADMARVLTGWTYGDTKTTNPTGLNQPFYAGPMKPVDKFHDLGQKTVLGQVFPPGQTAQQDFDQALALVFNHHNVGPFLCRELIQRLVTSNPSATYIGDVVAVFNNNGQGVRGDLKAVVKAILLHPEAANGTPASGKFSEPALFELTLSRALGAAVVDHPFLSDFSESMAQKIWFAPSIFNYFSPNFRAGSLFAPEMQIWTTATAMIRTNFVASLISGGFGSDVTIDYTPFTSVAADPNALLDTVDSLVMGGTMSSQMRQAIITAVGSTTGAQERVRTALYLAAVSMQYQVEH